MVLYADNCEIQTCSLAESAICSRWSGTNFPVESWKENIKLNMNLVYRFVVI